MRGSTVMEQFFRVMLLIVMVFTLMAFISNWMKKDFSSFSEAEIEEALGEDSSGSSGDFLEDH